MSNQQEDVTHPYALNQQVVYNRIGIEIAEQDIPENSRIIKNRIEREWTDYCHHVDPHGTFPLQMTSQKVYNFMFYQLFRSKNSGTSRALTNFNGRDYDRVLAEYSIHLENYTRHGIPIPHPPEGLGKSSLHQYRAYLRKIHASHVAENLTSLPFELVFTERCKKLIKTGEMRKTKQDRENYKEKVDKVFGPYHAVEKMDDVEDKMWSRSKKIKGSGSWLRNRFIFLYTTAGILRSESLFRAELSDFLFIKVKKPEDIHSLLLMITQIPEGMSDLPTQHLDETKISQFTPALGKTNHGRKIYGRATRHKDVRYCAIGALSFYLTYRFFITDEFSSPNFPWTNNSSWFDVKLLVTPQIPIENSSATDYTKPMKTNTYARSIKHVLGDLGIVVTHFAHLGRQLGAKILEMLEVESEEIRRLGNWNPSMQDSCYSTKLPMKPIRRLAGFTTSGGMYYNPRTAVTVPTSLQQATPIGRWVFNAMNQVKTMNSNGGQLYTAQNFLEFLTELNIVFLQDMATMMIEHPSRLTNHKGFEQLHILRSNDFMNFVETMRGHLHGASSPLDATLENVLPGVHERLDANRKTTEDLVGKVTELTSTVIASIENSHDFSMQRLESEINLMLRRIRDPSIQDVNDQADYTTITQETPERSRPNSQTNHNEEFPTIPITYASLHQLYSHWTGGDEFENMYPGGIARLEHEKGSSWRKTWDNSANKRLSKMKAIVLAIEREATDNNISPTEVLQSWEDIYSKDCKGKLSNFHSWAVGSGKIELKKARGRSGDGHNA